MESLTTAKKKVFYTELAYLIGLVATAFGVALMERADLGVSMVVAPAYVLYRKISLVLPFFTFGMAEYLLQAVLLLGLCLLLRRFRAADLVSFLTALLYGFALDVLMLLVALIPAGNMVVRIALYIGGMAVCAVGISLMFHTYIAPEVYELFTREAALHYGVEIHKFKTGYDIVSCLVAVALSFLLFGFGVFVGVRLGTVLCALINGTMIGFCSAWFEKRFAFADALNWRPFFTGEEKKEK